MSQQISKQYFGFAPRESIDEKKREDYCIFFNAEGVYSALDKMMKIAHPRKNQPVFIKSKHDNKSWYPILEREGILLEEPSIKDDPEYQKHLEAVKKGGLALQYAPENLRDREMCLEAVKEFSIALKYVPENLRDCEMCLEAVKQLGSTLEFVPENLRDREMCLEAVKQNGYALQFVPENLLDREMCLEAVKQYGYALRYAPENLRDREMCLEAVKKDGYALEFVPEKFKDKNGKFIEKEEQSSDYVPEFNELLEARVIDLVKNDSSMFLVISPMYKTAKVCTAFMNCKSQLDKGEKYELLPKQFQNKEFQTLCDLAQKFDLH